MPYKASVPVAETYPLPLTDKKYGCDGPGDEPTTVSIREATQGEHRARLTLFEKLKRVYNAKNELGDIVFEQTLNDAQLIETEIWLTLAGTNICKEDGAPVFKFKTAGGKSVVDMTSAEFTVAIATIDPTVVAEMHDQVMKKNPSWAASGN